MEASGLAGGNSLPLLSTATNFRRAAVWHKAGRNVPVVAIQQDAWARPDHQWIAATMCEEASLQELDFGRGQWRDE